MKYIMRVAVEFDKTPKELTEMCHSESKCPSHLMSFIEGTKVECPFGFNLCNQIKKCHWEAILTGEEEKE